MILKRLQSIGMVFLFLFGLLLFPIRSHADSAAYVIDETGVFTSDQLLELNDLAEQVTNDRECGVYVVITKNMHGYSERDFAEGLFFNYDLGYGLKDNPSGIILAIDYNDRFYDVYSYGAAGDTFTTARLDSLNDLVYDYLVKDDWFGACKAFINKCDELLESTGYIYHTIQYTDPTIAPHIVETSPEQRRNEFLLRLPFAALGSSIVGGISVMVMRGRNKRTGLAKNADQYIVNNGVRLTQSRDMFINRTRSVTRIQRDTGGGGHGGGGHSYHSSGGTHSSGGRHF